MTMELYKTRRLDMPFAFVEGAETCGGCLPQ